MKLFYKVPRTVFSRSSAYTFKLHDLGVRDEQIRTIRPGINLTKFTPEARSERLLAEAGVDRSETPHVLLYAGRVSVEKNLPLLADAFEKVCERRRDVCLVIAGDGPYRQKMKDRLAGMPAYFPGFCDDSTLPGLYATSDLFVFPSRTDTLGQVVMEAQACGLPCLVSPEGGPKETIIDKQTGLVLPASNDQHASLWARTISELVDDPRRLREMRSASIERSRMFGITQSFDAFWSEHVRVADPPRPDGPLVPAPAPTGGE
jgi:glycosyltransferase involved in cell wall biosynthesis